MKYKIIPVTSLNQNCSLIWCQETSEAALIDPGGVVDVIDQIICSLSLRVKKILLTHGHIDHIGGAKKLSEVYRVPIIGPHYHDKWLLENTVLQCHMLNFDVIEPMVPDYWLMNDEIVEVGNCKLHVLHCPGHSPGHLIFWNKKSNFIFMGDLLFKGSIGRTDLPGGNIKDLIMSVRKVINLGNKISFLPGHGPISNIGHEKYHNNYIKDFI